MQACFARRLGVVLALIGLAGCATIAEAPRRLLPGGDATRLMPVGSTWSVTAITATALPADNGMLLRRETRRRLAGTTACNTFGADLRRKGAGVAITDLGMTEMVCLGHSARQEAALADALLQVDGIAPGREGGIVLTGAGVGLVALAPVLATPPVPKAPRD